MTDPFALFDQWLAEARAAEVNDPEAMALATADRDGRPTVRMVLLKGHGPDGFVFYTNAESRKGGEIRANPRAALLFHWPRVRQGVQVRVEGIVEIVDDAEADAYFASRPRGSQLGAWASVQSDTLASREAFETHLAEVAARFDDRDVPRPPRWSGFRIVPWRVLSVVCVSDKFLHGVDVITPQFGEATDSRATSGLTLVTRKIRTVPRREITGRTVRAPD